MKLPARRHKFLHSKPQLHKHRHQLHDQLLHLSLPFNNENTTKNAVLGLGPSWVDSTKELQFKR